MTRHAGRPPADRLAAGLLFAWGVYQVLLGGYFILLRPALLPEDLRYLAAAADELREAAPEFEAWLGRVFDVLGGQAAGLGVLLILGGGSLWRRWPSWWELMAYTAAGLLSVALMSVVNFAIGSDFRWPLILPVAIAAAAVFLLWRARAR